MLYYKRPHCGAAAVGERVGSRERRLYRSCRGSTTTTCICKNLQARNSLAHTHTVRIEFSNAAWGKPHRASERIPLSFPSPRRAQELREAQRRVPEGAVGGQIVLPPKKQRAPSSLLVLAPQLLAGSSHAADGAGRSSSLPSGSCQWPAVPVSSEVAICRGHKGPTPLTLASQQAHLRPKSIHPPSHPPEDCSATSGFPLQTGGVHLCPG